MRHWRDVTIGLNLLATLLSLGCAAHTSKPTAASTVGEDSAEFVELRADSLEPHWRADLDFLGSRALWFRVRSSRVVGLLAQSVAGSADVAEPNAISLYFETRRSWLSDGGVRVGPFPKALVISASWYANALITMPDTAGGKIHLTWIAIDSRNSGYDLLSSQPTKLQPMNVQVERQLEQPPAKGQPTPEATDVPSQFRPFSRVIGSATVDLATGKVVRRSGAVR